MRERTSLMRAVTDRDAETSGPDRLRAVIGPR